MSGMSPGLHATIDTLGRAAGGDPRTGLRMLDGSDGAARLVFQSGSKRRRTAVLDRWLAIIRVQPPPGSATRVIWVLDGRTTRWSGGLPPGDLHRGVTGLDSETTPILWFRAGRGKDGPRGFTAAGVFGAAGIVDAAQVHVARGRLRKQVRLRTALNTEMWDLSASSARSERSAAASGPRLTISASGVVRPLELDVIRGWL